MADTTKLNEMHDALADTLLDLVKNGEEVYVDGASVGRRKASAAVLNVARQFLKDNHIDKLPKPGDNLTKLLQALPEGDEEQGPLYK